jgi:hypothetical protein
MCFDEPIKFIFPCFGKERHSHAHKQSKLKAKLQPKNDRYTVIKKRVKLRDPSDTILNLNYVNYYSHCKKNEND